MHIMQWLWKVFLLHCVSIIPTDWSACLAVAETVPDFAVMRWEKFPADLTIITSDNPRDEEPQAIIDDIKVGMAKTEGKYVEIPDRKEAIAYAIHHGEPGDIVVLAGKGHEDYQEIKGKKYPMDERVLIADILAGR